MLPYSPRWLVTKGRRAEAEAVLDLIASKASPDKRRKLLAVPPTAPRKKGAFMDMFRRGYRGRTLLGAFLQAANQLSGIDFVSGTVRYDNHLGSNDNNCARFCILRLSCSHKQALTPPPRPS